MNRRGFIKNALFAGVSLFIPSYVLGQKRELSREELGRALSKPIARELEYRKIGEKLLMVDELPLGALARYERDVMSVAHVIQRRSLR